MLLGVGQPLPQVAPERQEITAPQPLPANTQKDSWDKAYILFTGLLVFVGGITFLAVWKQAKESAKAARIMRRQSVILWRQTKANIRAAKAAESAAIEAKRNTQIIVDKERARVSLEVGGLTIGHRNDAPNESRADYTIRCNGTTQAEIIRANIGIKLHEHGSSTAEDHADEMNLPVVLVPGAIIKGQVYLSGVAGTDTQTRFNKGELFAYLHGWIIYEDIFGSSWSYDFGYIRTRDTQWIGSGKETVYEDEDEENSGPSATET